MTNPQWTMRCRLGAAGVLALLVLTACVNAPQRREGAAPAPVGTTAGPTVPPTPGAGPGATSGPAKGQQADTVAEFDGDPCAVASATEVRAAIAHPYDLIAANTLAADVAPSPEIGGEGRSDVVGCGFSFVAVDSDTSETYHSVVVRVARWSKGGAALLAKCRDAAAAQRTGYRAIKLGDEACLGPAGVLPVRVGGRYFTVAVTLTPGRADDTDEDVRVGSVTLAAARLLVPRLPGA